MLLSPPLLFFGGKGGVGKTTMAAATALLLAGRDQRTLLVSTDPAHSLGDVLGVGLGGEPSSAGHGLWAVEIDAEQAAAAHVEAIKRDVARSVDRELVPTVHRHLDLALASPGTLEAALFDRLVGLLELCPGEFDRIVVDTAPTGHTLRLLALPALLTAWVEGLARQREQVAGTERMLRNLLGRGDEPGADPLLARLHARRARFRRAGERLRDDAVFWLVLVPERLPIEETARAWELLGERGVTVGGLVVNRVLPAEDGGSYLAARRATQDGYLREVERRFAGLEQVVIEQLATDVTTREELLALAHRLGAVL